MAGKGRPSLGDKKKINLTIRFNPGLKILIEQEADKQKISTSKFIENLVKKYFSEKFKDI